MTIRRAMLPLVTMLALMSCAAPEITIDSAWIRSPPPGMNMTAAYFVLRNRTAETAELIGATADSYQSVTIHESRIVDGVWQMTAVASLAIGAGEEIQFKPGGLHLMMMQPDHVVAPGEPIRIRLEFADGKVVSGTAVVQDSAP